ncbi:Membrane protease YdiL, CAAX protease family [Streptoalloteichus tenebrarius]|uniref:Membrane protease YdiL, CAAX protease family n=1 Tax=Streptoalloteichus tenebrarius (strain ATCC 17920 / DSM 40477 / JCM 4838 / CBS 697.72 / NBRC 16177 / NCIMB 11028 / NRRL B-12390 / A12253. 1 / ISP 5477) TaxID=1933 RepID=A0ABT1HVK4_STRSD|nr:type II CAAX endopeptidase family protein [Streptoalloteichus tenebrarius]MCP2259560.1 Membrane protease YdiL, CAAX protease family [Streptoalloteichus tenebrarius]BFF01357.1 hypothetical protein GCM10020241_30320 [Streptoalloteichus tenebrarius]
MDSITRVPRAQASGTVVLVAGLLVIVGSVVGLLLTGHTGVRYSADHGDTVPMWVRWAPALVGLALVRLVPAGRDQAAPHTPEEPRAARALRAEALTLLASAVLFAVALRLAGGGEPAHTLLKLPLLLGVPAVLFWISRRRGTPSTFLRSAAPPGRRWAPWVAVAGWFGVNYLSPLSMPLPTDAPVAEPAALALTLLVGFVVNGVVEEVFYRRWLQTRWEALLGRWPAIVLASLVWAAWHVGIQGGGPLPLDLASVLVSQGVQGLFLGYLWSRYRRMWPILVVHGVVNAAPLVAPLL